MSAEERADLLQRIDQEGFEYTFSDYSDWSEIRDPMFHRLRKLFLSSRRRLAQYVGYGPASR
jgi:hypothetical protein